MEEDELTIEEYDSDWVQQNTNYWIDLSATKAFAKEGMVCTKVLL